eukprot:13909144-Ditylum_brightwellii.AAC.1
MCGDGMIVFECAVLVPSYENDSDSNLNGIGHDCGINDGTPRAMVYSGRRIYIFKVSMKAIVWMKDAD